MRCTSTATAKAPGHSVDSNKNIIVIINNNINNGTVHNATSTSISRDERKAAAAMIPVNTITDTGRANAAAASIATDDRGPSAWKASNTLTSTTDDAATNAATAVAKAPKETDAVPKEIYADINAWILVAPCRRRATSSARNAAMATSEMGAAAKATSTATSYINDNNNDTETRACARAKSKAHANAALVAIAAARTIAEAMEAAAIPPAAINIDNNFTNNDAHEGSSDADINAWILVAPRQQGSHQ